LFNKKSKSKSLELDPKSESEREKKERRCSFGQSTVFHFNGPRGPGFH